MEVDTTDSRKCFHFLKKFFSLTELICSKCFCIVSNILFKYSEKPDKYGTLIFETGFISPIQEVVYCCIVTTFNQCCFKMFSFITKDSLLEILLCIICQLTHFYGQPAYRAVLS